MTLYSLVGVLVTSATVVIYGIGDLGPGAALSRFNSRLAVVVSLIAILLATFECEHWRNVVSPANDFSNLWPRKISFKTGGVITCFMVSSSCPGSCWITTRHLSSVGWEGMRRFWAGGGHHDLRLLADRRRSLRVDDLYLRGGAYEYSRGFNWKGCGRIISGAAVALVGLVVPALRFWYDYSWFVGFAVSFVAYYGMMTKVEQKPSL